MKYKFLLISILILFQSKCIFASFYDEADDFFGKYVINGKVNYSEIKKNNELEKLVQKIKFETINLSNSDNKLAFYINAYNILTIKNIVDKYPVISPRDIDGFFDKIKFNVQGENLTLNEIENNKIRVLGDARIHFALVCAAYGCPKLVSKAYFPSKINQQLEQQTTETLNDPNFIRIKSNSKIAYVSEIFRWYASDFGSSKTAILNYINNYSKIKIPSSFTLDYYPYSWKLNKL